MQPTHGQRQPRRRSTHACYTGLRDGGAGKAAPAVDRTRRGRAWGGGRSHPQAPCATPRGHAYTRVCQRVPARGHPTRAGVCARKPPEARAAWPSLCIHGH